MFNKCYPLPWTSPTGIVAPFTQGPFSMIQWARLILLAFLFPPVRTLCFRETEWPSIQSWKGFTLMSIVYKYSLLCMWLDYLIPFCLKQTRGMWEWGGIKNPFSNKEPDDIPSVTWIPDLSLSTWGSCAWGRDLISWLTARGCQSQISSNILLSTLALTY